MLRPPSSVLGTAPWRRASLLLRRSPAVPLAVLAAGLIRAAPAPALFLSSAANAAPAVQMEERCPPTYGFRVRAGGTLGGPFSAEEAERAPALGGATTWTAGRELLAIRERTVRQAGALMPDLGRPVLARSGPLLQLTGATPDKASGGRLYPVELVALPQALGLADEPSAHQDAAWVHDVFAALRQVVHDRAAASLVATHDPDALGFADRVLGLADGELTERTP
jgi:hypothetical protein